MINTQELLTALKKVRTAVFVGGNTMIEGTDNFLFTGNAICGYDDEICIYHPFDMGVEGAVNADKFLKLIQSVNTTELKIESETNKLKVTAGKSKASFSVPHHEEVLDMIESLDLTTDKKWKKCADNFIEGLNLCVYSASNNITDEYLTCINIDTDKIISSDDLRISEFKLSSAMSSFLISAKQAAKLCKFNVTHYFVGDSWVYFKIDDEAVFCSRLMSFEYPDVQGYFEFDGVDISLPEGLIDGIDIASIMAEETNVGKTIVLTIEKNKLVCKGEGTAGWSVKEFQIDYKKFIEFDINPIFLKQILTETNKIKIGDNRALFKTDNFRQLISLRIKG